MLQLIFLVVVEAVFMLCLSSSFFLLPYWPCLIAYRTRESERERVCVYDYHDFLVWKVSSTATTTTPFTQSRPHYVLSAPAVSGTSSVSAPTLLLPTPLFCFRTLFALLSAISISRPKLLLGPGNLCHFRLQFHLLLLLLLKTKEKILSDDDDDDEDTLC